MFTFEELLFQFYLAIVFKDGDKIRQLLEDHPFISQEVATKSTPLEVALQCGHDFLFSFLMSHGAKLPVEQNWVSYRPLMMAAQSRCYQVVRYILQHRVELEITDDLAPLVDFGEREDVKILHLLAKENLYPVLELGLNRGEPLLIRLVRQRFNDAAEFVLTLPQRGHYLQQTDNSGRTALHLARSPRLIFTLLNKGADPMIRDGYGLYPLHWNAGGRDSVKVNEIVSFYRFFTREQSPEEDDSFWESVRPCLKDPHVYLFSHLETGLRMILYHP